MQTKGLILVFLSLLLISRVYAAGSSTQTPAETQCQYDSDCNYQIQCPQAQSACSYSKICYQRFCKCQEDCGSGIKNLNAGQNAPKNDNCDSKSILKDRIQCRLEQRGIENINATDESCKVLANPKNCQSLYYKVASCYAQSGIQKDQCFKRVAGFTQGKASEEAKANNKEALKNYIIFLLYDLQEKVEDAYKESEISAENASNTIALIVEIKQSIFLNKAKEEIKPMIRELRDKMQELGI